MGIHICKKIKNELEDIVMNSEKGYKEYILEMLQEIDEDKETKFLRQLYTIILCHKRKAVSKN